MPLTGIIALDIYLIATPVIILLGTVGNGLSLAVMLRKALRRSTTSLLLAALAVVDTSVLYVLMLPYWLADQLHFILRDTSPVTCKLHDYVSRVLSQLSPWIIVLVAVERLVVVFVPHKAHLLLTRRRVAASIAVTGCTLGAANLQYLWMFSYIDVKGEGGRCVVNQNVSNLLLEVSSILNAVLASFLPAAILVVSNVAIVVKIARERRNVNRERPMNSSGMTAMLVAVSVLFIVTTVPVQIIVMLSAYISNYKILDSDVTYNIMLMFDYINYAINFLLYCVSGSRFRREAIAMLTCRTGTPSTTPRS